MVADSGAARRPIWVLRAPQVFAPTSCPEKRTGRVREIPMCEINLTNSSLFALVDEEDLKRLAHHRWYVHTSGRVVRNKMMPVLKAYGRVSHHRSATVYLHRQVMQLELGDNRIVVHLDGDLLDNRRRNLQVTTRAAIAQSCTRRWKRENATSLYTGLSRYRAGWTVRITANGIAYYIGRFPLDQEELAARAYDKAARVFHGECATLNFPNASEQETAAERRQFHGRMRIPAGKRRRFPPVSEVFG